MSNGRRWPRRDDDGILFGIAKRSNVASGVLRGGEQIQEKVSAFGEEVEAKLSDWSKARTPVVFRQMELEVARHCRGLADQIAASILRDTVSDPEFEVEVSVAARQGGLLRHVQCSPLRG